MALERTESLVESTSPDAEWAFQLRNVGQTFDERAGIRVSSLRIGSGKITALVGRSGAGKSTLLHLLGGMLDAENLGGGALLEARLHTPNGFTTQNVLRNKWHGSEGKIGFVFQEPFLIRDASCRLNIELSLAAAGQKVEAAEVRRLWDKLAISADRFDLPARHLSGGMQQRVAVGRAIVRQPQIILADEPTASLDPALGFQIMELLQDWQCDAPHRSLIFVTHDIGLVERFANDVIVLDPASVGAGGQGKATIGRLLPGIDWPIRNPKDRKVIEAWMNAGGGAAETMLAASASSRKHDSGAERPKPACGGANANSSEGGSGWAGANLSVWYRMALATALNGEARTGAALADSKVFTFRGFRVTIPTPQWTIRLALGFAGGLLLLIAIALLVVNRSEQRFAVGALLLMPALALLLPRLWSRLGLATYFRSLVLGVLTVTGLISLIAIGVVRTAADHHLSIPALQVWLASQGKQKYNMKFVEEMQNDLVARKIVPRPKAASEHTVFGRHLVFQLASFVPLEISESGQPDCNSDKNRESKYSAAVSAMGISVNEPILSELSWRPVGNAPIKIQAIGDAASRVPAAGHPALGGDVNGGTLYISRTALTKDFGLPHDADVPRWFCVDISRIGDYAPFRTTVVVESLPGFDKAEFSFMLGTEAAAAAVDKVGIEQPSAVAFGLLAIRISPHSRDAILDYLRRAADDGKIAPEVGFAKLLEAVGAASVSVWLARAFAIIVLTLACVVTTVFIFQFIETNRRELSVALAFGAKLHQLTILIFTLLFIPFFISLVSAAGVAAFVLPPLMEIISSTFRVPAPSQIDVMTAFAWVSLWGIGLIFGVSVLTLTVWRSSATSLATQLQEVG